MMGVSVFNCVSEALDMLKFSTDAILDNAGTDDFDYIVVTWRASAEVQSYLRTLSASRKRIHIIDYQTNHTVGYVPNLRGMMNYGFEFGYSLNEYTALTNTDQYFGDNWLYNLVKHMHPDRIVSSRIICPLPERNNILADFGITEYGKFNIDAFRCLAQTIEEDGLLVEGQHGTWKDLIKMPYLLHRKFWEAAGPWELELKGMADAPDCRFFGRCKAAGASFVVSKDSTVYHTVAAERSNKKPVWASEMPYES